MARLPNLLLTIYGYCTMEPPIVDSPLNRDTVITLYTKDMTYGPSIIPTIHFEPPKEENLYIEQVS